LDFAGIWFVVCKWPGVSLVFQKDILLHFDQFEGLMGGGRKVLKRASVVWLASI